MAENILDQLKAFQETQEAARRTVKEIQDQRDLLRQVSRLAADISVSFNEYTQNIGKSAQQLKIGEEIEAKLNNSIRDRSSMEKSLISQLEMRAKHEKDIAELNRIASLSATDLNSEYNAKTLLLQQELALGTINNEQYSRQLGILDEMYITTNAQLNIRNELLNRTNSEISQTKSLLALENKKLDTLKRNNGFMQLGKKLLGDMGPLGEKIINFRSITAWSFFTDILEKGYENFKAFDKTAVSVRSNLGVLPGQASKLESLIKEVGIDSMHLGATFEDVGKSITAIVGEFNSLVAQDKELLKTTTALAKQFGITEGTSVKFLKTLGGISDSSTSSQRSMAGFVQKIAQAAGVPLGKIMEDIANASDDVRIYVGSSAVSMIKAAAAARMMGIDLNKAASSAEKLLQFETSISAELKASALLGQNINFNYARQLAFNKDIIGANKEILKIAKQVNFNQLNPIQQKAFADAAGKSVGELQDMLTQEKNIQLVRNGTNEKAKKALVDYERLMQLKEEEAKNVGKVAEQEILRKANQEKLAQIQNKFNQLMSELAQPIMDILDPLLTIATELLPYMRMALIPIVGTMMLLSKYIIIGGEKLILWGRATSIFASRLGPVMRVLGSIATYLGPLVKVFGTKIPIIGWLISGLLVIRNIFNDWSDAMENATTWGEKIAMGFKLIGAAIVKAFLPFEAVEKYVNENWLGKSPSKIGLGIVKGITSIGGLLLDALIGPFVKGYNYISKYVPGTSELKMPSEVLADMTGDSKKTKDSITATNGESLLAQSIQTGNQQMIAKIDQLINLMANGGIAVNMDGQRVQNALSRANYRSGGFGQSTTLA